MTTGEISALYLAICQVTTRFVFTRPVETADLDAFLATLSDAVPDEFWVTVEDAPPDHVRVRVGRGPRVSYERLMIVECGGQDTSQV